MKDYKLSEIVKICENQDDCTKCKFYNKMEDKCCFIHMPMLWNVNEEQSITTNSKYEYQEFIDAVMKLYNLVNRNK